MADQKVIITSTNTNGQTLQKTLTDINPDAGNTELKTFAQMLNGLTDNTYGKTDRVIKYNCDTEAGGGKQTPTLQFWGGSTPFDKTSGTSVYKSNDTTLYFIKYDGDASNVYVDFDPADPNLLIAPGALNNSSLPAYINAAQASLGGNYTLHIYAPETDNFKAAAVSVPITVEG